MLTRDALIKPKTKTITIEEGTVIIRALTASEAFEMRGKDMQSAEIFGLISLSIVEPALSPDDIGLLSASTVTQLTSEIFLFNALSPKAIAEAEQELKKTTADVKPTS